MAEKSEERLSTGVTGLDEILEIFSDPLLATGSFAR